MSKDKKQKFTNQFVAALAAPNTLPENKKYETLRDSKSNIILRNYRTGGKIFYAYYWFRDQTIYYNLGKWEQNYFNVDDARKRAWAIVRLQPNAAKIIQSQKQADLLRLRKLRESGNPNQKFDTLLNMYK